MLRLSEALFAYMQESLGPSIQGAEVLPHGFLGVAAVCLRTGGGSP